MDAQYQPLRMDVLVPINSQDSARKTVTYAVREYPDASITVLHVTSRNRAYGMGGMYIHDPVMESEQEYAKELFRIATKIADSHDGSIKTMTAVGCPVREIVGFAETSDTDHIVIGNCEQTGWLRFLFENVMKGVVYRSPVSVTVVK